MSVLDSESLFAEVALRLRAAAGTDRTFDAAQMQLINLPEIIQNAGPHWPRLKEKIRSGSVGFLKGCLDENDIVIPAGDGFLIIFAEGSAEDLKTRAQELRVLLLEFYLGQEELKRLGIKVDHRQVSAKELGAMVAPPPPPATEPTTDGCAFAPMWSPTPKMIASYLCLPVHRDSNEPRHGYDKGYAYDGHNQHRDYCETDLRLLDIVEAAFNRYGSEDGRPIIGACVHSTTLQNRAARGAYLERLSKVPIEHTKQMFIRIAEIETGAPVINLADWAGMLRARIRNVALEFHHSEPMAPDLFEVGLWGAGYRVSPAHNREHADHVRHARQFRRWGESLGRQRIRFTLDDVRLPGMIRLATEAGAHLITSDMYWPYLKWPGGVISAPAPQPAKNFPFQAAQKPLPSAAT